MGFSRAFLYTGCCGAFFNSVLQMGEALVQQLSASFTGKRGHGQHKWFGAMTYLKFLGLGAVAGILFYAAPLMASEDDNRQALKKADLIGVQAALSQRIVKSACFISSYSDVEQNSEKMVKSAQAFERNLGFLQSDALLVPWQKMDFAVNLLAQSASYAGMEMEMLSATQDTLSLALDNELSQLISLHVAGVEMVRLGGRLTSLSQKAAKEYCLISFGLNANANRNALALSLQEFDQTLEDLKSGNEAFNIVAPPTEEISNQLGAVEMNWMGLRHIMMEAANNSPAQRQAFNKVQESNETVMREARKLTKLYLSHYQKDAPVGELTE